MATKRTARKKSARKPKPAQSTHPAGDELAQGPKAPGWKELSPSQRVVTALVAKHPGIGEDEIMQRLARGECGKYSDPDFDGPAHLADLVADEPSSRDMLLDTNGQETAFPSTGAGDVAVPIGELVPLARADMAAEALGFKFWTAYISYRARVSMSTAEARYATPEQWDHPDNARARKFWIHAAGVAVSLIDEGGGQ